MITQIVGHASRFGEPGAQLHDLGSSWARCSAPAADTLANLLTSAHFRVLVRVRLEREVLAVPEGTSRGLLLVLKTLRQVVEFKSSISSAAT